MTKLIRGIGINEGKYPTWRAGKILREYHFWQNLIRRCKCPNFQQEFPTYIGCTVSENFKSYSYFYEWCQNQIGFSQEGYHCDKDLLLRGNKVYSENTCVFIPNELNNLLASCKAARGSLPIGVVAVGSRFRVYCHRGSASSHVGYFDTPNEAFTAYKQAKEAHIKLQAEKWKAHIDPRAFAALMAYEVLATD